jgi:preprotein translocase subunit SecD
VTPASGGDLASAAQLLRQRAGYLHLPDADARVSGRTVLLTGRAADEAQLRTLATAGMLSIRQVLLYEPAATAGAAASGDVNAVGKSTLALFGQLACTPGDAVRWKSQVGYTVAKSYDNPDAQVVACGGGPGSRWGKYVLGVAAVQGAWVTSATAAPSTPPSQWQVNLTLNKPGTSALTVVTAPRVQTAITDGNLEITGGFTPGYARELAAQLRSGPLPADFRISAIRTFTP